MKTTLLTPIRLCTIPNVVMIATLIMCATPTSPTMGFEWSLPNPKALGKKVVEDIGEQVVKPITQGKKAGGRNPFTSQPSRDGNGTPDNSDTDATVRARRIPKDPLAGALIALPNGRLLLNMLHPSWVSAEAVLTLSAGDSTAALHASPNFYDLSYRFRHALLAAAHGKGTNTIERLVEKYSKEYQQATSPFTKAEILQREKIRFEAFVDEARSRSQVAVIVELGELTYDMKQQAFLVRDALSRGIKQLQEKHLMSFVCLPDQGELDNASIEVPAERAREMLDRVDRIHSRDWREKGWQPWQTFMAYVEGTVVAFGPEGCAVRFDRIDYLSVTGMSTTKAQGGPAPRGSTSALKLKSVSINAHPDLTVKTVGSTTISTETVNPPDSLFVRLPDQRVWVGTLFETEEAAEARVLQGFYSGQLPAWIFDPKNLGDKSALHFSSGHAIRQNLRDELLQMATGPSGRTVDDLAKRYTTTYPQAKTEFDRMDVVRQERGYYTSLLNAAAQVTNVALVVSLQTGPYNFERQGYEATLVFRGGNLRLLGANGQPLKTVFVSMDEQQARKLTSADKNGQLQLAGYIEARVIRDEEYYRMEHPAETAREQATSANSKERKCSDLIIQVNRLQVLCALSETTGHIQSLKRVDRLQTIEAPVEMTVKL